MEKQLYIDFEKKWIEESISWLNFLRSKGQHLLELPIPTAYLITKHHFYDLIENGELHLQKFPEEAESFDINKMTKNQILYFYDMIIYLFEDAGCFDQMYLVKESKRLLES